MQDPNIQALINNVNRQNAFLRQLSDKTVASEEAAKRALNQLEGMKSVMSRLSIGGGGGVSRFGSNAPMGKGPSGKWVSLDEIPGRRIPYDFHVSILIRNGEASETSGTLYVTPDGPFVATARYAIFQSAHQFRYSSESGVSTFSGRSYGRFRPIHSANDIMDAQRAFEQLSMYQPSYVGATLNPAGNAIVPVPNPAAVHVGNGGGAGTATSDQSNLLPNFPGNGAPIYTSPLSMAAFRTMQFDGRFVVAVKGSQFQRAEDPSGVPSTFWATRGSDPFPLACEDIFDPGETIEIKVRPNHPNNPQFGNISGLMYQGNDFTFTPATASSANNPAPVGPFPFLSGQFDGHEGINDRSVQGDSTSTTDRVSRAEDGILIIGFLGYRILPPPGVY